MNTEELLKKRRDEVREQIAAIEDVSLPLREKRDRFKVEMLEKLNAMNTEVKRAEEGLFDLRMEHGRLAKATGGKALSYG